MMRKISPISGRWPRVGGQPVRDWAREFMNVMRRRIGGDYRVADAFSVIVSCFSASSVAASAWCLASVTELTNTARS